MAYLKGLLSKKPKGKTDENYIGEISRLDAELVLVRDDLVRLTLTESYTSLYKYLLTSPALLLTERYEASTDGTQRGAHSRRE